MNNILYKATLCAVAGLSMTSCADFLAIDPLTMVYEDNYWNEKNDVDQIVTGCYTCMQDASFMKRLFIWGESRSDNVIKNSVSVYSLSATSDEGYIMTENIKADNGFTNWAIFYEVINRCNLVIEKAPEVAEVDPSYLESDVLATIAEVSALRDLCYFYLVRTFKDVPYYTYAFTSDTQELELPATDGDEIVRALIADLEGVYSNALSAWPAQSGQDVSYGRITRSAIWALLADLCLWVDEYSKAASYAQMVIDYKTNYFKENYSSSYDVDGYPLVPDNPSSSTQGGRSSTYQASNLNFGTGGGPESIFELVFSSSTTDGSNSNDMVPVYYYRWLSTSSANAGPGLLGPSEALISEYTTPSLFLNSNDSRIKTSIMPYDASSSAIEEASIGKYSCSSYASDGSDVEYGQRLSKNDANWIFYRVSDVMLIKAEALICQMTESEDDTSADTDDTSADTDDTSADTDDTTTTTNSNDSQLGQEAFELIKAIADRSALSTESNLSYANYSKKSTLRELLFSERRREFLFEGKRWFDLVRHSRQDGNTNYLVSAVQDKFTENAASATSKLNNMYGIYWPYNEDELDVNQYLTQNPAYPEEGSSYESTK